MDIFVNDEKLEFTLDKKASLQEILNHIQEWASKRELYLIDYELASLDEDGPFHSGNIKELHLKLGDRTDLIRYNLIEMQNYIERVLRFLGEKVKIGKVLSSEEEAQLLEGKEWLGESLVSSHHLLSGKENNNDSFLKPLTDAKSIEDHISALSYIFDRLNIWFKQFTFNTLSEKERQVYIQKFLLELPAVIKSLEEIAADFTVGKEVKGFQHLDKTLEFLSDGLLYLSSDKTWGEVLERLTEILNELVIALSSQDMVNAADIIDYDLREIIDEIMQLSKTESID
jgi:hypothetical protein